MTQLRRRDFTRALPLLALGGIGGHLPGASAQGLPGNYPAQTIRIIVPFGPGGSPDGFARVVAREMSARVKQPVVVENRPGANSMLGTGYVARNVPADGYTVLYGTNSGLSAARFMVKSMSYEPTADLAAVAMAQEASFILVTSAQNKALNLAELVRRLKAQPNDNELAGASVTTKVVSKMMANAGIPDLIYVPYKENSRMLLDIIGGRITAGFSPIPAAKPLIEQGKLAPLAITGPERLPLFSTTPTLSEQLPGVSLTTWTGFFVPARTPRPIVDFLHKELTEIMHHPDLQTMVRDAGRPLPMAPAQMDDFVKKDEARWGSLFKAAGIAPE